MSSKKTTITSVDCKFVIIGDDHQLIGLKNWFTTFDFKSKFLFMLKFKAQLNLNLFQTAVNLSFGLKTEPDRTLGLV